MEENQSQKETTLRFLQRSVSAVIEANAKYLEAVAKGEKIEPPDEYALTIAFKFIDKMKGIEVLDRLMNEREEAKLGVVLDMQAEEKTDPVDGNYFENRSKNIKSKINGAG